jgi:hypothetical protein
MRAPDTDFEAQPSAERAAAGKPFRPLSGCLRDRVQVAMVVEQHEVVGLGERGDQHVHRRRAALLDCLLCPQIAGPMIADGRPRLSRLCSELASR